jgi:hypothetical protein
MMPAEKPGSASRKTHRWTRPAVLACGMLASLWGGYVFRDSPFDLALRREPFRLSADFRNRATPAYIALIRMSNTSIMEEAAYQKARLDAEAALAEASPNVRTDEDREAYLALRNVLESRFRWDGYKEMLEEQPNLPWPNIMTFDRDRFSSCWVVAMLYFDPARKRPDEKLLRQSKQDCNAVPH